MNLKDDIALMRTQQEAARFLIKTLPPNESVELNGVNDALTRVLDACEKMEVALENIMNANGCPNDEDFITSEACDTLKGVRGE